MEPTETKIAFPARVIGLDERFDNKWVSGWGPTAAFDRKFLGWFVTLEHSHEALYVGNTKPNIRIGSIATVRISFP